MNIHILNGYKKESLLAFVQTHLIRTVSHTPLEFRVLEETQETFKETPYKKSWNVHLLRDPRQGLQEHYKVYNERLCGVTTESM